MGLKDALVGLSLEGERFVSDRVEQIMMIVE